MQRTDLHLSAPVRRLRSRAGFTLADTLMGLLIGLVGISIMVGFNRFQIYALRNQNSYLDMQSSARAILDLFTSDVRRAGTDPKCARTFDAITEASSVGLRILADLNSTGAIDTAGEDVTYAYDATNNTIQRTAGGTPVDLITPGVTITGSVIEYFDASGTKLVGTGTPPTLTTAQRATIRRIRLTISLQRHAIDPLNTRPQVANFTSTVDVRNRYFAGVPTCS